MSLVLWRKKRVIRRLRKNMAFFGCDLSDITDSNIEEGIRGINRLVLETGISNEAFAVALRHFAATLWNSALE